MRKTLTFLFVLYMGTITTNAAEEYSIDKINPFLLPNTSAVKRFEYIKYEIEDLGHATYFYKKVITILNEKADDYAEWVEAYDNQFTSIKSVSATLYDAGGKKIRSLKKADIGDYTGGGSNLADNHRIKHHNFYYKVYPYTIEYEVEIKKDQLMFMPMWLPLDEDDVAVERSIFEIICPADYKLRYKAFQYNGEPKITSDKSKTYHWEVSALPAMVSEFGAAERRQVTPSVTAGATAFEIAGFKGDMSEWGQFGKFIYELKQGRDKLPPGVQADVHRLTDNLSDERKKIDALYNYMQQNTRYISVQLGIGGWQPFEAADVAQKKYGDCKALTNYMFSLLKEAGIRSVYTLVKAGENEGFILDDFPAQQFNHVILSVPLKKDTVWLECTSQTSPTGYLGSFTANRYALMVCEDGGHLVKTPKYTFNNNVQSRKATGVVDAQGNLAIEVTTQYTGTRQDDLFERVNTLTKKEQLEYLKKEISLPTYDVSSFNYVTIKSSIPIIEEKINLRADNYAQVSGKRLFIQPNILNKSPYKLKEEERRYDIYLKSEFLDVDSVEVSVPEGYITEAFPSTVSISNKFGKFSIEYKLTDKKVLMVRVFQRMSGHFLKSEYPELVKLYNGMYKADQARVILVKKEG